MNSIEHLLVCLGEEGSEIAKDCSKALRFGLDDTNVLKPDGPDNRERIVMELNDLMAVVSMLVERNILPVHWFNQEAQENKKTKVSQFMDYAVRSGALIEDGERRERCTRCGGYTARWVDPDWSNGRICMPCETRYAPKEV